MFFAVNLHTLFVSLTILLLEDFFLSQGYEKMQLTKRVGESIQSKKSFMRSNHAFLDLWKLKVATSKVKPFNENKSNLEI